MIYNLKLIDEFSELEYRYDGPGVLCISGLDFVLVERAFGSTQKTRQLNLSKIEELGSGSVYCQIVDVVHPGKIALAKVNWKAKNDYEFIGNLRLLQDAFNKIGIKRHIDVPSQLCRSKNWRRPSTKITSSLLSG